MIKLVCVGKIKDRHLQALVDDYAEKISHYHRLQIIEVKDEKITDNEKAVLEKEAERVLDRIDPDDYVILMDVSGKSIDSVSFAEKIDSLFVHNPKICFVIGGSLGLGESLLQRGNERIRMSDMTFLHQMCRLILLEQIYRSFKILHHEKYHK